MCLEQCAGRIGLGGGGRWKTPGIVRTGLKEVERVGG
jgi:hypothetical protein